MHPPEPGDLPSATGSSKPSIGSRRMRHLATAMLVAMVAVLFLTNVLLSIHPGMGYLRAFAEAAVVGALADWFAVTALFRQPLGLPIPHTAIVPRNKDRIGAALGRFVERNFASPEVIAAKLANVDLAGELARWMRDEARIASLADHVVRLIPQLLDSMNERHVRRFVSCTLSKQHTSRINLGPVFGEVVKMLVSEKRHQILLDTLLHEADEYVSANEPRIRQRVQENTAWLWQRLSMDDKVADSVILALRETVAEIARDPAHPLRLRLDAALEKLAAELTTSPQYREQIAAHVRPLVNHPALRDYLIGVWRDIRASLREDISSDSSVVEETVRNAMGSATDMLIRDEALRFRLNDWIRGMVMEAVQSHQRDVGTLIADTVRGWDTETMARRIEQQVGEDLQYIRINGTLIGGLVGLVIYSISRAFY